jgi:hypothetical protein
MKINLEKQKLNAEHRDRKFKDKTEFGRWLSATAMYCIKFKDKTQDCTEWFIDEGGEVLHADMQSGIWNGKIVDLSCLKVGKEIGVVYPSLPPRTTFYDFVVAKIEKVRK